MAFNVPGGDRRALGLNVQFCPLMSAHVPRLAYARQPLFVHDLRCEKKSPSTMHKRTSTGAAGVSPPWCERRSGTGKRIPRAWRASESRAAGVSPPWSQTAFATATVYRGGGHVSTVDPARTSHNRESQLISGNRQPTGAAGVSPPWFRLAQLQERFRRIRETAGSVLTNAGAVSVVNPRGAYAPRS
jgi:hypothetical protein